MRCHQCKKKTLITCICKCMQHFCLDHRYPESHHCNFDHKEFGKDIILQNNPKIVADKLQRNI